MTAGALRRRSVVSTDGTSLVGPRAPASLAVGCGRSSRRSP